MFERMLLTGRGGNRAKSPQVVVSGGIVNEFEINGILYRSHTFLTTDEMIVSSPGEIEYYVLAGGGGGGSRVISTGGGGAGGRLKGSKRFSAGIYLATVGLGGLGAPSSVATKGSEGGNSILDDIIAIGGGGGAGASNALPGEGGSGGGGGTNLAGTSSNRLGAFGIVGQGHEGGNAYHISDARRAGGGGGGIMSAGQNGSSYNGGLGGNPEIITFDGVTRTLGRGGRGGDSDGQRNIFDQPDNNGNGGFGAVGSFESRGRHGGSGIIMVRYPIAVV